VQYLNNATVTETVRPPVSTVVFPLPRDGLTPTLWRSFTRRAVHGKYTIGRKPWQQLSATAVHCW